MFTARLRAKLQGGEVRVCGAFWLFGLINNVLYVIILSAALDLVGPAVPKGLVLLADVVPGACVKLAAPYFIHHVAYRVRIIIFVVLSTAGMFLIALTPETKDGGSIGGKMVGVVLASLSCGGGELSFLAMTHFYGQWSLAAWSSGTGAAGLVGAGAYVTATTVLGWSIRGSLLASAVLPQVMMLAFFVVLPLRPLRDPTQRASIKYEDLPHDDPVDSGFEQGEDEAEMSDSLSSTARLHDASATRVNTAWHNFTANLRRTSHLFVPYMLPLFIVYVSEYLINQGVTPTLLWPLSSSPFQHFRDFYPTYNWMYQAGVFISRSSTPVLRIHRLYPPSILQFGNLVVLVLLSLSLPTSPILFYATLVLIFWEGLLGGVVYVNTFAEIADAVPLQDREFSLGATSVSDALGICVAGFLAMAVEPALCKWQVNQGREFCTEL